MLRLSPPVDSRPTDLTNIRYCPTFVPLTQSSIDQIIDELLANQTNEEGVQVTAQWVLSLGNNGSYLVHTQPRNPAFQVSLF